MKITISQLKAVICFSVLAMLSFNLAKAQSWDYVNFTSGSNKTLNNACLDGSNNLYTYGEDAGFTRVLRRFNSAGSIQWTKNVTSLIDYSNDNTMSGGVGGIEYSNSKIYVVGNKGVHGVILESGIAAGDPTTSWEQLSGTDKSSISDIKLKDGYLYVVGYFGDINSASTSLTFAGGTTLSGAYKSAFIAKYTYPSKSLVWAKKVHGSNITNAVNVDVDDSGNVFVTGHFRGTATFYNGTTPYSFTSVSTWTADTYLAKFNSNGGFDNTFGLKVDATSDNYNWRSYDVEVNETNNAVYWAEDKRVRAYTKSGSGNLLWSRDIGSKPFSLKTNNCGDIYVTGKSGSSVSKSEGKAPCGANYFAASLNNTNGTSVWVSNSTSCLSSGNEVLVDSNNKELFVGSYAGGNLNIDGSYTSTTSSGYFIGRYTDNPVNNCTTECEITAPTNLQVSGTILTWDTVPGATSYIITSPPGNVPQIDCNCGINGISLAPITVGTNSYALPISLQNSCFVWQVTAVCENGETSPISSQACYTPKGKDVCETTAPTNLQVSGTTLTWDPIPGATGYIITSPPGNVPQIDCNCGINGVSLAPITVGTNSYALPASLQNKCFIWQVTAICESGKKSPISNQACYTPKGKDVCETTAPTNLQVSGATLTWDPVPGAIGYIITSPPGNVYQIDCNCGTNGISLAPIEVNTNSYTLSGSLQEQCFVWQVTAICESGEKSPISSQACYNPKIKEKCEVIAPIGLQVEGTTLTWNAVEGATNYIITSLSDEAPKVDCDCGANGISLEPIEVETNSYVLPESLYKECFIWQITAVCESGEKSLISNQACYSGLKKTEKNTVSIAPNPNRGEMNIMVNTKENANVILSIYRFNGTLMHTINNLKTKEGQLDFNLNLQSKLSSGMYFFIFNIEGETVKKKVIIE